MIKLIRKIFNPFGCDLVRYPHFEDKSFVDLLHRLEIDSLFDIGANVGQFAEEMRKHGYTKKIISFEPLNEAFCVLKNKAKDDNWIACHSAIGNEDGKIEINISKNLVSSSILEIQNTHINAVPDSFVLMKESVPIYKIDSIIDKYAQDKLNIFVKIDTQGFEKNVIDGALLSLSRIQGFIMELSFITLYKGETLFFDMVTYMDTLGYDMWQIIPGFYDKKTQRVLQADVVFVKKMKNK